MSNLPCLVMICDRKVEKDEGFDMLVWVIAVTTAPYHNASAERCGSDHALKIKDMCCDQYKISELFGFIYIPVAPISKCGLGVCW